jgi:hypothetical protein
MTKKSGNKKSGNKKPIVIPENFKTVITDFVGDLSGTFPEYQSIWETILNELENNTTKLFEYLLSVLPERFFDILYQNEDIFQEQATNTCFLPGIDFKTIYNCHGITETTKKAIWKYLQLILFTIMDSIKDKSIFKDAMNIFDGINESDLQEKLGETVKDISDFFTNIPDLNEQGEPDLKKQCEHLFGDFFQQSEGGGGGEEPPNTSEHKMPNIPNPDVLHEHLRKLFDGKIGKLAKEIAEELSENMQDLLKDEMGDIKTPEEMIKHIMKNPKKMMDLIKVISTKLTTKMQRGDISQDEMMSEARDFISQMKMGGGEMNEFMKNIMKNMGKNVKLDTNALSRMEKQLSTKERLRKNLEKKRQENLEKKIDPNAKIETTPNTNQYVFKMGDETPEKTTKEEIDELIKKYKLEESVAKPSTKPNKKKGGK